MLIRNGKCFDTRRTTYEILRILMKNIVADGLNVDGRRDEKLPFIQINLYSIIIGM